MSTGAEIVRAIIELDRAYRNPEKKRKFNIGADLYSLDELDRKAEWDFSMPTLVEDADVFGRARIANLTSEEIVSRFYTRYPLMKALCHHIGAEKGIAVAGSSAGSLVYGKSDDVDIFLYGFETSEEADSAVRLYIEKFIDFLQTRSENSKLESQRYYEKYSEQIQKLSNMSNSKEKNELRNSIPKPPEIYRFEKEDINIRKTKNTLTFSYKERIKYQFVLRVYRDISEIIHGFDLGSSAVAFDGKQLLFTSLGKFCYEYGLNIVDTTRRSTTYEHRLRKYQDYGFDIVLPELDIDKMQTRLWDSVSLTETCDLPNFVFTYKGRKGNKILLGKHYFRKGNSVHDYEDSDFDEYNTFYLNISNIIAGKYDSLIYVGDNIKDVLDEPPGFSEGRVRYFYDNLEDQIWYKFPVEMVAKYFDPAICSVEKLVSRRKDPDFVREVIERQISDILEKAKKVSTGLSFMMENPGTQLTSSFNPIIEDPSEWYMTYYKELPDVNKEFLLHLVESSRKTRNV